MNKLKNNYTQYLLPIFILILFILLIIFAWKAFFPLFLSIVLAYILNPLINYFEVRGVKRIYAVSSLYILAGLFFAILIFLVINFMSFDVATFKIAWPNYLSKIEKILVELNEKFLSFFPLLSGLNIQEKIFYYTLKIPNILVSFLPSLILFFIIPFISFFILITGDSLFDYILDHIPSKHIEIILHITTKIDESLGRYLRGIITEAFIVFLLSFFALFWLKIKYFTFISIIIGISSLVPYLGAIVGVSLSLLVGYLQYQNIFILIKIIIFFVSLRFFDDWFLQPYIMKKAVKLNPAIVIFSLMVGVELGGFWGVVFAIPITCILKEILLISLELQESEFSWKPKPEPTRIEIPYT